MGWQTLNTRLHRTRLWRLLLLGLVMLGLVIALPSCRNLENNPLNRLRLENFRIQSADVPRLISTTLGEPKSFNYILSKGSATRDVLQMMYSGLITRDPATDEILPALAESWVVAEDGKTITYTLKDNLKWSDGKPLTVDDVVFTFNDVLLNEDIPTGLRDLLRIGEEGKLPTVRKLDARRVAFTIPEPFAPFLGVTGMAIMPKHMLEKTITTRNSTGQPLFLSTWGTDTDPTEVVGNGPYIIKQFIPGERIILERNPYYWKKGPNGEQQPYIEQLVWPVVSSQDAEFVRFRSGDADLMNVTPNQFALIKQHEEQGDYTVYNGGPVLSRLFVTFNLNQGSLNGKPVVDPVKSAWFNTVAFRQAVAYAIDRETMLNNIFKGLGELQNSHIPSQSPYFAASDDLPIYNYNLEMSRNLLRSAGFEYRGTQLYDAAGNQVRFTIQTNVGNKVREAAGAQIKQNLARIGIQVDFQPIDFNKMITNMDTSLQWDAIILSIGGGGFEPNSGANLWRVDGNFHTFNQQPPNQPPLPGRQIADWEQEISDLYVQAAQELDESKRKALYAQTQILVQENLPFIYLVGQYSMVAVRNKVKNVEYTILGGVMGNIDELVIREAS